jgi:hypothetical protein
VTVQFVQHWFLPAFITFAILMYAQAIAGFRVQEDTKKRGLGKAAVTFWSVSVVFFGIIFLPLYLMFRSRSVFAGGEGKETEKQIFKLCPHFGDANQLDNTTCGRCHKFLDEHQSLVGEKQCPYCGAANQVDAARCRNCDQIIGIDNENE